IHARELVKKRFFLLALVLVGINLVVFASVIWFKYPIYTYYDGWFIFTREFRKLFLNLNHVMFSDISYAGYSLAGYWHAGCPLYPFIAAAVSIVAGNVIASMIITSTMFSLLGVYFIQKIAKEFMHYDDAKAYQLISIFITLNVVSEFFFVPLPISITLALPIMDTYYFLRFFHAPSARNGVGLSIVFTLTLFTRELIFPMLLVPLTVLVLLKLNITLHRPGFDVDFKHMFVRLLVTTVLIPCAIYAMYLLSTGTHASLLLSLNNIWDCPKTPLWFFYSTFNTITFNWVLVLFCFILFLKAIVQGLKGRNLLAQEMATGGTGNQAISSTRGKVAGQEPGTPRSLGIFLEKHLVDYTIGTWAAIIFLSRIFLPGCPIEAYFLPCAFSLAVYVFKGTRISHNPRVQEYLFWFAIATNLVVLATQAFPFYPFFDSNMLDFIEEWLRREMGWPFYP
ncbi:MAG: hypothetical protein GYA24_26005, partial [Candidatus Lokiarchaeota archaeon]|nr:hypothetical protein [Candidatus Lokiarchaeota archaeon]